MVDYLQTFLVRASRTVADGKTHNTVSDGAEGLITERSGLERHVH